MTPFSGQWGRGNFDNHLSNYTYLFREASFPRVDILQQKHSIGIGIADNLTLLSVYVPWVPEAFLAWLLNPMCRILLNFAKCYILSHWSKFENKKNFPLPFLNYKPLKLQLRVFLADHAVAMVSFCVTKMKSCSLMIRQFFNTMILAFMWPCILMMMIITWLFSRTLFICALVVPFAWAMRVRIGTNRQ